MRICNNPFAGLLSTILLIGSLVSCQKHELPEANTQLSYPAGEVAIGGSYTSAQPSLRTTSTPQFAISGLTHNGQTADMALATINAETGVITITPPADLSAMGVYLVSVKVTEGEQQTNFPDALKLVVKGIVYDAAEIATTRGTQQVIPVKEAYLVQQEQTHFELVVPEGNTDYKHLSVDPQTCAIVVAAEADAGVYPISIKVVNRTNPDGTPETPSIVFDNVITITVESKPYDLEYTPASISLIPMEGHTSPRPTLRAATLAEGTAVTYSLLDAFDGMFTIDATTGAITLAEDTPFSGQVAKNYPLQVRVTNAKGATSFPEAYTITIDPDKKADPITAVSYPGTFPVALKSGEAWTSERPTVTGSTVGIQFSLKDAPAGASIDAKTGIITLDAGHEMPLLMENNALTVEVANVSMSTPFAKELAFAINSELWKVGYKNNFSADAVTNSGIANMDRYSFSSYIQNNQTEANKLKPSSNQVKNGFGKAKDKNGTVDAIEAIGAGNSTWSDNVPQNNDWIVSTEIEIPAYSHNPAVNFGFSSQFGGATENFLELYIIEVNETNVYTKGEQDQNDKGMTATPSDLSWQPLASTNPDDSSFPATIDANHSSASSGNLPTFPLELRSFDISAYKGKTVRIALRYWNTAGGRTYRISALRVEDSLTK